VTAACQHLIDDFLKPRFLPTIQPTQFNYPVDVLGKWHGTKYRSFNAAAPVSRRISAKSLTRPSPASTGSAAIASTSSGIATGEWFCQHRGLTLAVAIDTLRSEGLFHPL
jgi:hypothetical protein